MTARERFDAAFAFAALAVVLAAAWLGFAWGLCAGALRAVWRWLWL